MNWRMKTSSLFLIVAISAESTLVNFVPPTVTLAGILSISFLAYTWLAEVSEWNVLFFVIITFVTAAALTTLNGILHGWDSWLYVGSSQSIMAQGWSPEASTNTNAHQFPGIQFTTVLLGKITGMRIVAVAKYLPILLKLSAIIFTYLIAREVVGHRRLALLVPILLVSFTPFIAWLPYHHLTYGFVLTLAVLYVILVTVCESERDIHIGRRSFIVVALLLTSLLISHQLSMFQVMVLIGLTIGIYTGGQLLVERRVRVPWSMVTLWTLFFSAALLYYLWVGTAYFVGVVELQLSFSSTMLPEPDPLLERTLEPLNTGGGDVSTLTYWAGRKGKLNLIAILVFGVSAIVILYDLLHRVISHRRLDELDIPTYVVFGYVGTYGAFRALATLGIGRLGGTRRLILSSLPFAIAGVLAVKATEGWNSVAVRAGAIGLVLILLTLSTAVFPGYLLNDSGVPSAEGDKMNRIFLTSERQSTYEWTRYGSHAQVDTQGMLYVNGVLRTTKTHVNPRVYAGDFSVVPEGTLFVVAEAFKRRIPMRGHPFEYRIPDNVYDRYAMTSELQRVYDSGQSKIYRTLETP